MFNLMKTLLTHRATYRFLLVLLGALGLTVATSDINQLEALVCSLVTCVD